MPPTRIVEPDEEDRDTPRRSPYTTPGGVDPHPACANCGLWQTHCRCRMRAVSRPAIRPSATALWAQTAMMEYPAYFSLGRPQSARVYDYLLGGRTNFTADRELVGSIMAVFPEAEAAAHAHRGFVHRATHYLVEHGLRQFLDIGVGIPHEPNLHQIAQHTASECRVVYIDCDPIVLVHARALLRSSSQGRVTSLSGDLTEPQALVDAVALDGTLELDLPVALCLCGVLPLLPDPVAGQAVKILGARLAPGSALMLTQATADLNPRVISQVADMYRHTGIDLYLRSLAQVEAFFDSWDLVEPVRTTAGWYPGGPLEVTNAVASCYAGVALKPISARTPQSPIGNSAINAPSTPETRKRDR